METETYHLNEGNKENNSRQDADQEPWHSGSCRTCQESSTFPGEAKEGPSQATDELEDIKANSSSQNEQSNDILEHHADYNSVPLNSLPVSRGRPQNTNKDK